ncbi:MAG: polymer-forming cytoskeletal protein [Xanthobacteraceae bacterium]
MNRPLSAISDEAEIRGRFEGADRPRNRLLIKATGWVAERIRYGQIEIECGGRIFGDIRRSRLANSRRSRAPIRLRQWRTVPPRRADSRYPCRTINPIS